MMLNQLLRLSALAGVKAFLPSLPNQYHALSSSKVHSAMERLHDPSTNSFPIEHVYSSSEIEHITHMIEDDEWMALGSAIADSLIGTILDICSDALKKMGWVERASVTAKVAEDVSKSIKISFDTIRFQRQTLYHEQHSIPDELLSPLYKLVLRELKNVSGDKSFECNNEHLSLLVVSTVGEAIESYLGLTNVDAPFFSLLKEMNHRVCIRRKEMLVKHSKGYENMSDVERDIKDSRKTWVRINMGRKAASNYHFGEITTKVNKYSVSDNEEKRGGMPSLWNALIQDLDGVVMP